MARRQHGRLLDGVLLLDKPVGLSSNHALQRAKRAMDARKAGHTGTLDPFATGLLVCCFGKATKISGLLLDADKAYEATIQLGVETDAGDLTGNITATAENFTGVTEDQVHAVLPAFRGAIQQVPPMYSALKRDGKPLYEYARQGIELDRPPRDVSIHQLEIIEFTPTELRVFVQCSKGTYIRTLAQDIGRALGCYAHLTALRRTQVGPFTLDSSIELEALQNLSEPEQTLIALSDLPAGLQPVNPMKEAL